MLKLDNLREGEKVEMVIRRHWIIFVFLAFYGFIGLIINILLYILFTSGLWLNILTIIYVLGLIVYIYIIWINHELDMYVVTNSRIIGIEQIGFLNRQVSQCTLKDVQEVNSKTQGFFANMLDYGDLTIQTAGNTSNFKMEFVPDSLGESRKVLNYVEEYKGNLHKKYT